MIAQVLTIEGGDQQRAEASANLRENVIPQLEKAPGLVAGYWLQGGDSGKRMTVVLWEDAQSLDASEAQMKERREQTLSGFGMRITSIERYEVIAHAEKSGAPA